MKLDRFSVTGEAVIDEEGIPDQYGDAPVIQAADPMRKIHRYEDKESLGVNVRLNPDLTETAKNVPVVICRLAPPHIFPPESEMTVEDRRHESTWIENTPPLMIRVHYPSLLALRVGVGDQRVRPLCEPTADVATAA